MAVSIKDVSSEGAKRVADNFWFVFFAYFLAIAAWTAVSGTDFISSRWRTVAETRKRGQTHLLVVSLPMSYMVVYIYFQAKSGDYKELCATLVAFGFAILHMVRTVLGLWELHIFKHWAMRSICTMESLGYRPQLSSSDNESSATQRRSSAPEQQQKRDRAHNEADSIIVNDTIVDNRLSEGDVQCYLKIFTSKQKHVISNAENLLARILLTIFFATKNAVCLVGVFWPFVFSRSQLYSKPSCTAFLEPREPEEVWLRWATVLMSCAFPNWVADMRRACSEGSGSQKSEYEACRDRFAEEILLSAALHCERCTTNLSSSSFLPFHEWHKFPKLRSGTFCKQEFLKYACSTGSGLPFQVPHSNAVSGTDEDLVYSYAKYDSKLERARDALPANEGAKLKYLGIEELEWFSIFLSVEDWGIGSAADGNAQEDEDSVELPNSEPSGIAIENLCNQLGFQSNSKQFPQRLAAPFLKARKGAILWGNRNVLELSAHIDNWLALLAGEQVAYMVDKIPSMEEGFLFRNVGGKDCEDGNQELIGLKGGIREEFIRLEKQRHMFQLSVVDPEFSFFDQSLTFMGCSMENLRSCMARWVDSNPDKQARAWEQALNPAKEGTDPTNSGKFEFLASGDFEECLLEISSLSCWSQRFFRMRLLWELQNHLHSEMSDGALSPNQTEAMLLCILSFPAIRVIASEIEHPTNNRNICYVNIDEQKPLFFIENCKLILRASFGPQNFHIEVFFSRPNSESRLAVSVQLCSNDFERGRRFIWEAWRDAFYGFLEGTMQWQADHKITKLPISVHQCSHNIGAGVFQMSTSLSGIGSTMKVWKGWPSHREMLSKFEIMTDGLILQRKKIGAIPAQAIIAHKKRSAFIDCPLVEYVPVSYNLATSQHLTQASLIAHEFLRKAAVCFVDKVECASDEGACERYKGDRDLELLLYEIAATKDRDDVALGKALSLLISENPTREATERAIELLERYFTSEATKYPLRRVTSLYKPFQNKNWLQEIKRHYEKMMTATGFDPMAAISYAGFCTFASSYSKEELNRDCIRALEIAIIQTNYSGSILLTFQLTKSLETLIETDNEDRFSLGCAMYSNKIEHATKILSKTDKFSSTKAKTIRRDFKLLDGTFQDPSGTENLPLLPKLDSELKKAKADAQVRLAHLFELGADGVATNASRAVELYTQAIDNGNMTAAYNLAHTLENGVDGLNGVPADPYRAIELFVRAMDGGIDCALNEVARLYTIGKGVTKNLPYAVELYTKAIEGRGNTFAMKNLAKLLIQGGEGVPVDAPRAIRLYSRAVDEGGDVSAMQTLAFWLQKGAEGVQKDTPSAVRLYERAIDEGAGHNAKFNLANILDSGEDGVPANVPRAIALYTSAIEEGENTSAMYNLALLYLYGTGVTEDAVRAARLFQRAIDKDNRADALIGLAGVLKRGAVGVSADPSRAIELYTRAIEEHGSGEAMYRLGRLFEYGAGGVPEDSARAFSLYSSAALEKNHERAAEKLSRRKASSSCQTKTVEHVSSKLSA